MKYLMSYKKFESFNKDIQIENILNLSELKYIEEAFDIGYEDYLYSGNLCVIEWPEMIEGLLNLPKAIIFINGVGDNRTLILSI